LVGPLTPSSSSGKRYILTLVDYATRYPEAVALSESQESVKSGKIGTVSYEFCKGLLYRIYKVPDISDLSQLVVPVQLPCDR